jgi:hypothetical protein
MARIAFTFAAFVSFSAILEFPVRAACFARAALNCSVRVAIGRLGACLVPGKAEPHGEHD